MAAFCVLLVLVTLGIGCVITQDYRLIPGPDKGRLEVLYDGVWGTVCQSTTISTNNQAASVACRSLNQPSKNAYCVSGRDYQAGKLMPQLDTVLCSGREKTLFDCELAVKENSSTCYSPHDVIGIVCTDVKLEASFLYLSRWFDSSQRIDVYSSLNRTINIRCYPGTNNIVRGFTTAIRGDGISTGSNNVEYTIKHSDKRLSCTISNWQMPEQDTLSADVNVLYKPTVRCERTYRVSKGSKVNITCEVDANPPPHTYVWTKVGGDVVYDGNHPNLLIDSMGPKNAGRYTFTAINIMEDSTGQRLTGKDWTEITIELGDGQIDFADELCPGSSPMSTIAYIMTAFGVVSLVVIFVLVVVVVKLKKARDSAAAVTHVRKRGIDQQTSMETTNDTHAVPPGGSQRSSSDSANYCIIVDINRTRENATQESSEC